MGFKVPYEGPVFVPKDYKAENHKLKAKVKELEAKIERLTSRGFEDLHFENEELKAKVAELEKEIDGIYEDLAGESI